MIYIHRVQSAECRGSSREKENKAGAESGKRNSCVLCVVSCEYSVRVASVGGGRVLRFGGLLGADRR